MVSVSLGLFNGLTEIIQRIDEDQAPCRWITSPARVRESVPKSVSSWLSSFWSLSSLRISSSRSLSLSKQHSRSSSYHQMLWTSCPHISRCCHCVGLSRLSPHDVRYFVFNFCIRCRICFYVKGNQIEFRSRRAVWPRDLSRLRYPARPLINTLYSFTLVASRFRFARACRQPYDGRRLAPVPPPLHAL